jgi:hypothetical protein
MEKGFTRGCRRSNEGFFESVDTVRLKHRTIFYDVVSRGACSFANGSFGICFERLLRDGMGAVVRFFGAVMPGRSSWRGVRVKRNISNCFLLRVLTVSPMFSVSSSFSSNLISGFRFFQVWMNHTSETYNAEN